MEKVKFKPLGERVLVLPVQAEEKTSGGILIPDTAKEKPQQGKVVAVGQGDGREMTVKEGDMVIFGKFAGTEVLLNEEKYLILKEDEIYGIL
ncbi:MAG: co-chaperone GroES [Bacteroidales bacterium]